MTTGKIAQSAIVTALFAASTFAVAQTTQPQTPRQPQTPPTAKPTQPAKPQQAQSKLDLRRVSDMHGKAVTGSGNEKLGDIQSLAIDLDSGKAHFAVISTGGVLGVGDDLTPVPFKALSFGAPGDDEVRINVTKEKFDTAAKINDEQWERLNDPTWVKATYQHFGVEMKDHKSGSPAEPQYQPGQRPPTTPSGNQPGQTGAKTDQKQTNLVRSTEAIGMDVHNTQDEDLGEVNELVVDVRSGQIAYCVLGHGGALGMGEELYAIPWQAFRMDTQDDKFVLNMTEERLQDAPRFERENWPNFADASWSQDVHEFYGTDPDWIYGFAEEERDMPPGMQRGPGQGWEEGSAYNRLFQSGQDHSVTGTISNVERTSFMPGMSEGVALMVRGSDGQTTTVHVGPASYVDQQGVKFNSGDQITVEGKRATISGKQVLMASEIQHNNKTIQLREEDGTPRWSTGGSPSQ